MLSSILKSPTAIEINIRIMRAFVALRQTIATVPEYGQLKEKIKRIESQLDTMSANYMVDGILIEKKIGTMNTNIRRISETSGGLRFLSMNGR